VTVACHKRTYWKKTAAQQVLRAMKTRVVDPFRLTVYWCPSHQGWHIGNQAFSTDAKRLLRPRVPGGPRST
jgi:hypothetical protein